MFKLIPVICLALFFYGPCSKKRPAPIPIPQPTPVSNPTPLETPTPSPIASPEPSPVPSPVVTPSPTGESANKTSVPPESEIIDSNGAKWTLADGAIFKNGLVSAGTGTQLVYCNRIVFALGTDGAWWMWNGLVWSHFGPANPCTAVVTPSPGASPAPTPTASPVAKATPFATPNIDANSYIPAPKAGTVVKLQQEGEEDYAAKIQAVMDSGENIGLVVIGPGSVKRPTIWRYPVRLALPKGTVFACDIEEQLPQFKHIPLQDVGCFLLADNVHVDQPRPVPQVLLDYFTKGNPHQWRTDPYFQKLTAQTVDDLIGDVGAVLDSTYSSGWPDPAIPRVPQVAVFQALNDLIGGHMGKSQGIAITGVVIRGRQQWYDGGVRSTIQLGNCHDCTVQNTLLHRTPSIGISAGGSALGENNRSINVLFKHNITINVPAANLALVNSEKGYVIENYCRSPGRTEPAFAGGVSCFDLETNSWADYSKWIYALNNLADYEGGREGAGSAFVAQDPYLGPNHGLVVLANNAAIGGRDDRTYRYMSNGIFLKGLRGCQVSNNYVYRTGQNAVQAYLIDGCVIEDTDMESTGSSTGSFYMEQAHRNIFRRNNYRDTPGLQISTGAGFLDICGSNNVYEKNLINGEDRPSVATLPCAPALAPKPLPVPTPQP